MNDQRTVTFTTPLDREGCTHVVVYQGRGFLFDSYNNAVSFKEFVVKWLGAMDHSGGNVHVYPVATVGDPPF